MIESVGALDRIVRRLIECVEVAAKRSSLVRVLARIIHEADIVRHNIKGRQNLQLSYPKHRVLKPEAQALNNPG